MSTHSMPERIYKEWKHYSKERDLSFFDFVKMAVKNNFWFWHPAKKLKFIGITGTNGKTSTAILIESVFNSAQIDVALISTLAYRFKGINLAADLTTPDPVRLHHLLSRIVNVDVKHVVMETSSHGLAQNRLEGVTFDTAVFTNLSHDHLDYHLSMDRYFETKLRLFQQLDSVHGRAIINMDDIASKQVIRETNVPFVTYGVHAKADLTVQDVQVQATDISFLVLTPHGNLPIHLRSSGEYNIYNVLAAIGVAQQYGFRNEQIISGIESTRIPGRFEPIDCGQDFTVIVDFAHSPDALKNLLYSAKKTTRDRLICVFGCNGDRDRLKRPMMGRIGVKMADYPIITTGNPRSEPTDQIFSDILQGIPEGENYQLIPDRKSAIKQAIEMANAGDTVVIAGRGDQRYQETDDQTIPFDDRQVARSFLDGLSE
ncbi:TPA: UDP-N-acetylmuramoyl-L-alanyl-D-glutamate--2,6-diaminopimelate ligase [Candidatus Poribacteria bacterium]|nr:UDP-N-acetylmuramoyl-L-alanyl-D-glutamate--2,6-diaminopimelate ligase [Candidatus Poribacteria bacterium]HIA65208.1 UDP-N-acetylmuramoyl-L-alanyl-D-glutamate--2,6-diaminopimelate ligase [Candidatus Poribacteria bacterium]HIC00816.1 UDP-N-acetylmuramoyl-L-alanyl-D-glutamate--2,6-diaminopimelate ligase [Candidatus Poribacteria bacterium]HIC17842.1 UDP-N-acetylmuramoyl-L-alanyl-D-glutamate--2,6-diaminopimelate ligase [Candidatus Poribacteria bacterium]HIN31797.1 UDP-N-acetylmuramoyl-L-alanyl-D-